MLLNKLLLLVQLANRGTQHRQIKGQERGACFCYSQHGGFGPAGCQSLRGAYVPDRQNPCCLVKTILIDDPVQQMDEMNVCAFLDLIRGLSGQHQFIIFTCSRDQLDSFCPEHGKLTRSEITKGYEYEKGKYITIEQEDLEKIKLESTRTIELIQFVGQSELVLYCYPNSLVVTTAPTWRQVENILWAEIRRQNQQSKNPLGGNVLRTQLRISDDWFAIGLSTDEPDRFQGFHSAHLLLLS